MPGDAAERALDAPGVEVEVAYDGIAHPVELVGEVLHLAGDVGAERCLGVRYHVEGVQVAAHAPGRHPRRLSGRAPQHPPLDLEPDRVSGDEIADAIDAQLAPQQALPLEEADDVVADDRRARDAGDAQAKAVVD